MSDLPTIVKRSGLALAALGFTLGLTWLVLDETGILYRVTEGWIGGCVDRMGPNETTGPLEACTSAYGFWFASVPICTSFGLVLLGGMTFAMGKFRRG